jgi:outer membrane receptor for ferrienterochelin and colicins
LNHVKSARGGAPVDRHAPNLTWIKARDGRLRQPAVIVMKVVRSVSMSPRRVPARAAASPVVAAIGLLAAAAAVAQGEAPAADTVVVTATRYPVTWVDAPAAISVIPRREIEARGADNVLDAIRGVPGLSLQGRGIGGRKVISIRGMDSDQTLYLLDGKRVGASDGVMGHSDYQYDWMPMADVERIEVVRGPLSALYGSEAMGGVVNVITRRPSAERWSGSAAVEGLWAEGDRGGDGWRVGARAAGPLAPGLTLDAGAAQSRRGAVASAADPRLDEAEGRDKRDGWVGLGWTPVAGHDLAFEWREGREQRWANAVERGGRKRLYETVNDIDRRLVSGDWRARWGGAWDVETQLRAYASSIDVVNTRTNGVVPNPTQRITDDVLDGQAVWELPSQIWAAGFEARNEALEDPGLPDGRSVALHRALFVQDEIALADRWDATLGLRWDDHSLYGGQWSPRVYLVYTIGDGWSAKGGYGHGFKAPNLKQIVPGERREGPNVFLGNPDLEPEVSDSFEIGIGRAKGGQELQLIVFDNRVDDLIAVKQLAPGPVPGTGVYTYENIDRARMRGVEAALAQPFAEAFTARLSYTYLDAKDGDGNRLERRPRHSASAGVEWSAGPWSASLRGDYTADQVQAGETLPSLTLWYASATYALRPGVDLVAGVDNLTDVDVAERSPQFSYAEPPRTWRLALRAWF